MAAAVSRLKGRLGAMQGARLTPKCLPTQAQPAPSKPGIEHLVPAQPDPSLCLMCGKPGEPRRAFAAILTPRKDEFLWLHLDPCHAQYVRQQTKRAESLVAEAY